MKIFATPAPALPAFDGTELADPASKIDYQIEIEGITNDYNAAIAEVNRTKNTEQVDLEAGYKARIDSAWSAYYSQTAFNDYESESGDDERSIDAQAAMAHVLVDAAAAYETAALEAMAAYVDAQLEIQYRTEFAAQELWANASLAMARAAQGMKGKRLTYTMLKNGSYYRINPKP